MVATITSFEPFHEKNCLSGFPWTWEFGKSPGISKFCLEARKCPGKSQDIGNPELYFSFKFIKIVNRSTVKSPVVTVLLRIVTITHNTGPLSSTGLYIIRSEQGR